MGKEVVNRTGAVGKDEIAVTMNSGECVAVMMAIKNRLEELRPIVLAAHSGTGQGTSIVEYRDLLAFVDKCEPLVTEMERSSRQRVYDIVSEL